MTPDCCKKCPKNTTARLCNYTNCYKWRAWFRREWEAIQQAVKRIKEQ